MSDISFLSASGSSFTDDIISRSELYGFVPLYWSGYSSSITAIRVSMRSFPPIDTTISLYPFIVLMYAVSFLSFARNSSDVIPDV